jgi:hypothetical protein
VSIAVQTPSNFADAESLWCSFVSTAMSGERSEVGSDAISGDLLGNRDSGSGSGSSASHLLTPATFNTVSLELRCSSPSVYEAGQAHLSAFALVDGHLLNHGDWIKFTFYDELVVPALAPDAGPMDGGTRVVITGSGLASGFGPLLCRFKRCSGGRHI